jgi:hypothetical protein
MTGHRAVSWLMLLFVAACSPIANLRPASGLMPGKRLEAGAGVAALGPRPYVSEDWALAGQLWLTGNASPRVALSALGAFDSDAFAAGGAIRLNVVQTPWLAGGVEGELGLAWAGLSVPFALRLFDESFLYTAPRLGTWSSGVIASVPLGLSVRIAGGLSLRAEGGVSWQDFAYYNRRTQLAAGAAYQF